MKQLAKSVSSLYDLLDSAYDAPSIRQVSEALGNVFLIDQHPRRGEKVPFDPCDPFDPCECVCLTLCRISGQ